MLRVLVVGLLCLLLNAVGAEPFIAHAVEPYRGPVAYVDKKSRLVLYAETDGKHLSAIDSEGRVLWTRSPFADAHLKPYRVAEPRIIQVYAPLPWMLQVAKGIAGILETFTRTSTGPRFHGLFHGTSVKRIETSQVAFVVSRPSYLRHIFARGASFALA